MTALRVAIVGFGKIARDQHVPAIAATDGVTLAAVASRNSRLPHVPHFTTLEELLRDGPPIDAIGLCTPPQVRRAQAAAALSAGKHVMLEKPPGASVSEVDSKGAAQVAKPAAATVAAPPAVKVLTLKKKARSAPTGVSSKVRVNSRPPSRPGNETPGTTGRANRNKTS